MPPRRPGERQGVRGELKSRRTKLAGLFLATMAIWLSGTAVAQAGNLTIALDAVPDADTRFLFQVTGPTSYGGILLQDNGNPADGINNQHTVPVPAGIFDQPARPRRRQLGPALSGLLGRVTDQQRDDRRDRERDLHVHLRDQQHDHGAGRLAPEQWSVLQLRVQRSGAEPGELLAQ